MRLVASTVPSLIQAQYDDKRRRKQSPPETEALRRATQCCSHSHCRLSQKGRGPRLCDLLADGASEQAFKKVSVGGIITERFLKEILCGEEWSLDVLVGRLKQ